jgi:glutamyl-tRNA synthetase
MTVRVRFAPSPTGHLHIGGVRTALYNWLWARHNNGVFVYRSDDTDGERSEQQYVDDIVAGLVWLGIDWDEGIGVGGPHGTYKQSDRFHRYREVAETLVAEGKAYYSFATREQLDAFRKEMQAAGKTPAYDGRFRVDPDEAARRIDAGEAAPIRFAVPRPGETVFEDVVRGEVAFDHEQVDDFVILRSDGSPTYHLASTVDDVDYAITHVIRGEDILSSTPKHVLVTEAMGAERASYAHLSLLMGPDGSKLSKRHGDTSLRAYREMGLVPDTLVNYLALLGWSPGDDEIVDRDTMVRLFDLTDVTRASAVFDRDKLLWMNGVYIRNLSPVDFAATTLPLVEADLDRTLDDEERATFEEIAALVQERAKTLDEVPPQVRFLFSEIEYDEASWTKVMGTEQAPIAVREGRRALVDIESWSDESVEAALRGMLESNELSARKGLQPLRVAISGSSVSPPLFESIRILGKERSLARLDTAAARLGT